MDRRQQIVEQWIERLAESRPDQAAPLRTLEPDPFRNPAGYTTRKSLTELWKQLQSDMAPDAIDAALDAVIRLRAVQDMSPGEAVEFVAHLRPILRQYPETFDPVLFESRIDQLVLATAKKYWQCREQIATVRLRERKRMSGLRPASGRAGA